ncbi:MAG: 4Fe-4S binding protein [Bacteroidota bacterium]
MKSFLSAELKYKFMLSYLKKFRVVTSVLFLLFTSLLFLDVTGTITNEISEEVLFLQFIPSFLKFIDIATIAAIGFLIIIIITLLYGRVYCSTICPLGIFQDLIIYYKRKREKIKFSFQPHFNWVRYSILVVTITAFLFGNLFLLYTLDPYSNYGRILTHLVKPLVIGINNVISYLLEIINNYSVAPLSFNNINIFTLSFSLIILIIVFLFSYNSGRFFCNTLCPVGSLLGFLSKFSLFKIAVNKETCVRCGVCETVCKAECIDSKKEVVDFTRCVSCFNCFAVCPTHGLKYEFQPSKIWNKENGEKEDLERRSFLASIFAYTIGLTGFSYAQDKIEVYKKNKIPVIRPNPISPPGSISIGHLSDYCTACHLCVSACPTHVLQPSFLEYGFTGMMLPMMNNKLGFCDYECTICTDVCPTDAIKVIDVETKKRVQIGKAKFIKDNCIVYTQGTACGACSEHCPTKAVTMIPIENNLQAPEVKEEICIGCGACEFACPTIPYKAIFVESNPLHLIAEEPKKEIIDEQIDYSDDFPF